MKPSFNFLDLLPFQLLGGAGIVCALFGWEMGGFWLLPSLALAAILLTAALRSVPMR